MDLLDLMMDATEGDDEGSGARAATEGDTVAATGDDSSAGVGGGGGGGSGAGGSGNRSAFDTGNSSSSSSSSSGGGSGKMSDKQLQDECVTFFLAGHDTTSTLLSWTLMLLAQHPHWQQAVREEVREVLGGQRGEAKGSVSAASLTLDKLAEMKTIGWVLNESLRLYPPVAFMSYRCLRPVKLSEQLTIPANCNANIPVALIHRSKELWGEDADEFKPDRFSVGSSGGGKPGAFMPFSLGPRFCIGQNFALQEAKVILALLALNFSWELSPSFQLFPQLAIIMKNKYGMPLLVRAL